MEPDLEFLPLQSLLVLNSSLEKVKSDAVLRLHALQKANHDLLSENARLRQRAREAQKRPSDSAPSDSGHTDGAQRFEAGPGAPGSGALPRTCPPVKRDAPMSIAVQLGADFTAAVETRISLSPPRLRTFFGAEPHNFQYKVILIEAKDGVVENASTVVTRNAQITLRKLQNDVVYHVTVHCTVPGAERRLTGTTKFVYHQRHAARSQPLPARSDSAPAEAQAPISAGSETYTLNVQVGEAEYLTCTLPDGVDPASAARQFLSQHKLKAVLLDGLVSALQQLRSSGVTIRSVDVADLL